MPHLDDDEPIKIVGTVVRFQVGSDVIQFCDCGACVSAHFFCLCGIEFKHVFERTPSKMLVNVTANLKLYKQRVSIHRTLTVGVLYFKFLCVVGLKDRLSNCSQVSAKFVTRWVDKTRQEAGS